MLRKAVVFVTGVYGNPHVLSTNDGNNNAKMVSFIHMLSFPLSSVRVINKNAIVVASYNGILYCVNYNIDDDDTMLIVGGGSLSGMISCNPHPNPLLAFSSPF